MGDSLSGTLTAKSCSAAGGCTFSIVTRDVTSNTSRTLTVKETVPYTAVRSAVLGAYSVSSCSQYPSDSALTFSGISVKGAGTPTWRRLELRPYAAQLRLFGRLVWNHRHLKY